MARACPSRARRRCARRANRARRIVVRLAPPRSQRAGGEQAGAHQQRRAERVREVPAGAGEVGDEADREQRRRPGRSAAAWRGRRWRGTPARTPAAPPAGRRPRGRAGRRRRRRARARRARGRPWPAAPCAGRARAALPARRGLRRRSCPRRRSRRRRTWTHPKAATASAIASARALDRRAIARVGPKTEQRRTIGGVRAHGAIFTAGVALGSALDRTLVGGRAASVDRRRRAPAAAAMPSSAPSARHVRCRRDAARAFQSSPRVAWRTSSSETACSDERAAQHDRSTQQGAAAADARPRVREPAPRVRTRPQSSRRRRAARPGRRGPSRAAGARVRCSALARVGVRPSVRVAAARHATRAIASSTSQQATPRITAGARSRWSEK